MPQALFDPHTTHHLKPRSGFLLTGQEKGPGRVGGGLSRFAQKGRTLEEGAESQFEPGSSAFGSAFLNGSHSKPCDFISLIRKYKGTDIFI